jgi:predicted restriction endonuclease
MSCRVAWNKGLKGVQTWSAESRKKKSDYNKKHGLHPTFAGRKHTKETRLKMSLAQRGEKGSGWKGGVTKEYRILRARIEYKEWRTAVFKRDNYTCQMCKVRGVYLEADHIKPFAFHPELRYDVSNGRTLCRPCHRMTETYGVRARKTQRHILEVTLIK